MRCSWRSCFLVVWFSFVIGCGRGRPAGPAGDPLEYTRLQELGELWRIYTVERGEPPRSVIALVPYEQGFPDAVKGLKRGEIVGFWGAPITAPTVETPGSVPSDKVLAYDVSVQEKPSFVLLADRTVTRMSPADFARAPKATPDSRSIMSSPAASSREAARPAGTKPPP